ncbi:hypothetical protein EEO09_10290, partial [Staphylococcus pseudintermedius]|nr:hypothetical protein [Staphylococcus pseudintermedius]
FQITLYDDSPYINACRFYISRKSVKNIESPQFVQHNLKKRPGIIPVSQYNHIMDDIHNKQLIVKLVSFLLIF